MWTAVLAVAAGCQTVPEEFSAPTWTPVAAVPLVDTRFDLSDVLEVLTDSLDTVPVATTAEGELAFYHEQGFTGSIAEEWLILPDYASAESVTLGADEAFALNLLPPGQSITFSDAASAQLDVVEPENVSLDRIELSAGTLSFDLTTTMGDDLSGNCTIPGLVDPDGVPYSLNWNSFLFTDGAFSATQDLTGWVLLPDNTGEAVNLVEAEYTLTVINNPNHEAVAGESLSLAFGLSGMAFDRVEGDFGSAGISLEEDAVTLSLFDDRFTTSGLEINRASLRLEVENGFGVEATLDSLNLVSTAGGTPDVLFETTADPLIVAPADGSSAMPSLSVWEIDETNSNVVDFFTAEPRDIDLSMQVRCNPDGPAGISGNFLDVDGFVTARLLTEIPLSMRAAQIDFVDTVDVDIQIEEQAEVDSAELRLILHNGFPFEVVIRARFLDADGVQIDSLSTAPLDLFTMPLTDADGLPVEPGLFVHDFFLDWERADRLRAAERVILEAWCETAAAPAGQFVRITEEQGLRMELGLLVYAKMDF